MTTATDLYRKNPEQLLEAAQRGDVMPVKARACDGCLACVHVRPGLGEWPCEANNMPSARSGRCSKWSEKR